MQTDEFKVYVSKRYFDYIKSLEIKTNLALAEVKRAREKLDIAGVSYDKIGSSTSTDSAIPDGIANLFDVIDRVEVDLQSYNEDMEAAKDVIRSISDDRFQCLLKCRYILGLTWDETAKVITYSVKHCQRMKDPALIAAFEFIPYEWKTNLPKAAI